MDFERFKAVKIIMQRAQVNNCPISAVKTTIYKDTSNDKKVFANEFKNNGEHTVVSFSVRISCFNEQVKLVGTIKDYQYNDVLAPAGGEFGQNKLISSPDDSINSFAVAVTHIEFEDDYYWDESIGKIASHKEVPVAVEMAPEIPVEEAPLVEEEPAEQTYGHVIPETVEEGIFTQQIASGEQNVSVTAFFENESAPAQTEMPQKITPQQKEPERTPVQMPPEPERTPVQTQAEPNHITVQTQTEPDNTVSGQEQQQEENKKGKKKKKEKIKEPKQKKPMPGFLKTVLVLVILAALAVVFYFAITKYNQYSEYNRGAAYMANGNYDYAITVYTRLGNYEDSPALLVEAKKAYAASLYEAGEYQSAIDMYRQLGNQDDMILQCYNGWILSMEKAGQYKEALQLAESSGLAIDETIISETKYQLGKQCYDNQAYEDAMKYFTEIGDYEDAKKLMSDVRYAYGMQMMEVGNYEKAVELFNEIKSYKDVPEQLLKVQYLLGMRYKESHSYEKAIECFETAIEYEDSAEQIKECYFVQAEDYQTQGQFEKAMEYFKLAGDFEGAEDAYYSALYQYLLEAMKSEVTPETMDLLAELPKNYEDSANIIKTLKKYVDHVGEYEWTTSNDKDINEKGGFEDHIFVKLTYSNGEAYMTVDGNEVDLKKFKYDSGTNSNTYTMLNTTTITRTFNGKVHTYKKIIEK